MVAFQNLPPIVLKQIFDYCDAKQKTELSVAFPQFAYLLRIQIFYPCDRETSSSNPSILKVHRRYIKVLGLCLWKNVSHIRWSHINRLTSLENLHVPYNFKYLRSKGRWKVHHYDRKRLQPLNFFSGNQPLKSVTQLNLWNGPFCHNAFPEAREMGASFVRLELPINGRKSEQFPSLERLYLWFRPPLPPPPYWRLHGYPDKDDFIRFAKGDLRLVARRVLCEADIERLLEHKCCLCVNTFFVPRTQEHLE